LGSDFWDSLENSVSHMNLRFGEWSRLSLQYLHIVYPANAQE